jgi:predicted phage terminase large subunit-like protein
MAFGKSETSSMVVGQAWKLKGVDRFLFDQVRRQMDFTETQQAFRDFSAKHPDIESKYVENKANGPAIISSLGSEISGILAVDPEGDKVARAMAEQPTIESGHIYLPHPLLPQAQTVDAKGRPYNWVTSFVDEAAAFPNGLFKDTVDTASMALMKIRELLRTSDAEEPQAWGGTY